MNYRKTSQFIYGNIFGITDIGKLRKQNEDNFLCKIIDEKTSLIIVADGIGGSIAGEVASNIAIEVVSEIIEKKITNFKDLPSIINEAVTKADEEIKKRARIDGLNGMGTTIVVSLIKENYIYFSHIGDSRLYLFRDKKLKRITKDHSYVQQLVDKGIIDINDMENHPRSNIITQSLGGIKKLDIGVESMPLKREDIFLTCSDGLSREVRDGELLEILLTNNKLPLEELSAKLVRRANENGGRDNITVALFKCTYTSNPRLNTNKNNG